MQRFANISQFFLITGLTLLVGRVCEIPAYAAALAPGPAKVSARGTIGIVTLPCSMKVVPQTINPKSGANGNSSPLPHVMCKLDVSAFADVELHLDTVTINGTPLMPLPLPVQLDPREMLEWQQELEPTNGKLHLFFSRQDIVDILGSPEGQRTITLTMSVGGGHQVSVSDKVKLLSTSVTDSTPPTFAPLPRVQVERTSAAGTPVTLTPPTVSDNQDPAPRLTSNAPALFPLGLTTITWTATDASGNSATATQIVEVRDTTGPTITKLTASPNELWSPNHKMEPITITVQATDADATPVQARIIGITCSEVDPGEADWEITGTLTCNLRSEKNDKGKSRIYFVQIQCTDKAGNHSTQIVTVTVPHSQGNDKK
jgi:hypothetical protein